MQQYEETRTMSSSSSSGGSSARPFISGRSTVVNRSIGGGGGGRYSSSYTRTSYGGGAGGINLASGVLSSLSHQGVVNMRNERAKEKKDMQDLNERLANYIEKVRYLEALVEQSNEIIAQLRSQKQKDFQPIRDMYEAELAQARKVIEDMGKDKAQSEAKVIGLQEENDYLRKTIDTLQKQARDYISKIDTLTTQNGEYEGELGTLRRRVGNLEDEIAKQREFIQRQNDEIRKLRADVDAETAAHIEADNRAQSFEEEVEFLRALLDKMPQESQQVIKIKGMDPSEFWKGEVSKTLRDLNAEFEHQIDQIRADSEMKQQSLMRQLQSGAVKDNMELANLKEEVKKLRASASDKGARLGELEARLAAMEVERNEMARQLHEAQQDLELERTRHSEDVARLQAEMEACLEELKQITDAKLGLELEIACYRQLLEGEENRVGLKQIVEQAVGAQTRGSSNLADIISQQSSLSESTGRLTIKRSSRGPISIQEAAYDGTYIIVENTASGAKGKTQNMRGWSIVRKMSSGDPVTYRFPDMELRPGQSIKIWCKVAASKATRNDMVGDFISWGTGSGTTEILDENGVEKANMTARFTGN